MTRRDGSAIDRLLATRFSTGTTSAADAPAMPPNASPPAQPPPVNTFAPA